MPTWLLPVLLDVLPQIPNWLKEGGSVLAELSKQEDGATKIANILQGAAHLIHDGASVLGATAAAAPPAPPASLPPPDPIVPQGVDPNNAADALNAQEAAGTAA